MKGGTRLTIIHVLNSEGLSGPTVFVLDCERMAGIGH